MLVLSANIEQFLNMWISYTYRMGIKLEEKKQYNLSEKSSKYHDTRQSNTDSMKDTRR